MTLNVQDVADRVKRTFGDDAGVQIIDADIIRWVNDAQSKIAIDNEELLETVGTADIIANQADYATPTNMNVLRSLMFDNYRLKGLSFAEFNEYLDGFKVPQGQNVYGTGRPEVFMVFGSTITLFPTPNKSITGGLRIYYYRYPDAVANLADSLTVPERYHISVVEYCLKQAYEMDENADMTAFKKSEFENELLKLKNQEKTTSNEFYPRITTLVEDDTYVEGIF